MRDPEADQRDIEAVFRHGSVTGIGVLAGLLLTFLTAGAANLLHDRFGIDALKVAERS